jgi:hypothetical protein
MKHMMRNMMKTNSIEVVAPTREDALIQFGHELPQKTDFEALVYRLDPVLEVPEEWMDE